MVPRRRHRGVGFRRCCRRTVACSSLVRSPLPAPVVGSAHARQRSCAAARHLTTRCARAVTASSPLPRGVRWLSSAAGGSGDGAPGADGAGDEVARVVFRSERLWPIRALTCFCALDTAATAGMLHAFVRHADQLPPEHAMLYVGGAALMSTVPPFLFGALHWIRTRLVVELAELPAQTAVDDQPAVPRRVRLGFAAVLPASTSSGVMFVECPATELSAEYDGGVAYLQSAAAGGRRYVLDPVELAAMYKDPEEVGPVLQFLAGLGEQPEL